MGKILRVHNVNDYARYNFGITPSRYKHTYGLPTE